MATKIPYKHYDLKEQRAGARVEIVLSAVANVRLMTDYHFRAYKDLLKHQFVGGVARKSPVVLTVPQPGHWHLVVDCEGHHGLAESSIRVIAATKPAQTAADAKKPAPRQQAPQQRG